MEYEDVSFPALGGTNLEGWYIPAKKQPSKKIVICNHFSPGNRYGYAGHIKPWNNAGGFEVKFLPKYQALVEEGYNVLAYDSRNHGFSAPSQNGGYNPKFFEFKDIRGSLNYVRSRKDTKDMEIHLHSMCLGGDSTLVAMPLKDASPIDDAQFVKIPTLVAQVRKDKFTYAEEDVQAIYDAIPVFEKKLHWIEGTTERFKGYTYFSEQPQLMLDWYNKYSSI